MKQNRYSRFGQWIVDQVHKRETTITRMALDAGLGPSTLRYLVIDPDRRPSADTCMRLAKLLKIDQRDVLTIAGLDAVEDENSYDPNRANLLMLYDQLPTNLANALLGMARTLAHAAQVQGSAGSHSPLYQTGADS